ncbi:hypothetical protein ACFOUV_11585 [Oceanobacillus longus]|uniref:Uncharacterized protein n=1 Tax=Oceanobacillus longus TaxID=930120 RepID=A0ABV8H0H5_9BACI
MNYLEIAQEHKLNLIEVSILVQLEKRYPTAVSMEELTTDEKVYWQVMKHVSTLVKKDIVEKDEQKYRVKK